MRQNRHLPKSQKGGAKSHGGATTRRAKAGDRPKVTTTKGRQPSKTAKKRGRKQAATRANAHRDASSQLNVKNAAGSRSEEEGMGIRNRLDEKYNNKLSHEETLHVMNNRSRPLEEIQAAEVATIVEESGAQEAVKMKSSEEIYRQTIANTKVPMLAT